MLCIVLLVFSGVSDCDAADPSSRQQLPLDEPVSRTRLVLAALRDSFERVESGSYEATGVYEVPAKKWVWELELTGAFDREARASKHFRKERKLGGAVASYLQVFSGQSRLEWMSTDSATVGLFLPCALKELSKSQRPRFIPWTMSMSSAGRLFSPFPDIVDAYETDAAMSGIIAAESSGNTTRLVWHDPKAGWTYRIEFRTDLGSVPVRYEAGFSKEGAPREISQTHDRSTTEWKIEQGVPVPIAWSAWDFHNGQIVSRYTVDFHWTSVNKDIDQKAFGWHGLSELPQGAKVFDSRKGPRVLVGRVGAEKPPEVVFGSRGQELPYLEPSEVTIRWPVYAAVAGLLMLFASLALRRLR